MSFFSGLFSSPQPQRDPSEPSSSQELFNSAKFDSPIQPSPAGPSGSIPPPPTSRPADVPLPTAPTAFDTFSSAYDPAKLHPLAGLGDKLDFLQLDEDKLTDVQGAASVLPSRGWTDDLCVGTGTTYLSGESSFLRYRYGRVRWLMIRPCCWRRMGFEGRYGPTSWPKPINAITNQRYIERLHSSW